MIDDIENLPPLRDIINNYKVRAKKSLGQNFLLDLNLTAKIANIAGDLTNLNIIEIGAGPGGLSRAILLNGAKKLYAVEKDSRCIKALTDLKQVSNGKMAIIEGDALKLDLNKIVPTPKAIIANLPYNIATVLLLKWLKRVSEFEHMTLMFQKEVALRICAKPNSKAYGRLSVMAQWLCDVKLVFDIPAEAFTPPPKVTSSVVHLSPKENIVDNQINFEKMEKLLATAFGQRRKMLRKSLKPLFLDKTESILKQVGIKPTSRAEDLSVGDYVRLCNLE